MKQALERQAKAALAMLGNCIADCPPDQWDEAHGDAPFCQAAFHALFYADLYLGRGMDGFRGQEYHLARPGFFRDYEELEDRLPAQLYAREDCLDYLAFCRAKLERAIAEETDASLAADCGFPRRSMSRLELYVYLTRHLQHHAAQLGLRLQLLTGREMRWVGLG